MFDTTVVSRNETTVIVPPKKPDVTKIVINKREDKSVFIKCEKDDDVWKGLFYSTPFLNRSDSSRGHFYRVEFEKHNPNIIRHYEDYRWCTAEENNINRKRYNENIKTILRIQAVDVIQFRFINEDEVIVEIKYLNPAEV